MKKLLLSILTIICSVGYAQSQKNVFDPALCDANDYLWFNTEAVGNEYVGEGKLIEVFNSTGTVAVPILGESVFDATLPGAGPTGTSTDAYTGSIKLGFATDDKSLDGGSVVFKLPSCNAFIMTLSSFAAMRPNVYTSADGNEWELQKAYAWLPLTDSGGRKVWAISSEAPAVVSDKMIYVKILNCAKSFMFIHNVRVTGPIAAGVENAVSSSLDMIQQGSNISFSSEAEVAVFSINGSCVKKAKCRDMDLSGLSSGCYIVKAVSENGVYTKKICLK